MARHHVIISGTGRAGTTFLVQLLTQLGLDTGFSDPQSHIHPNCNAGMEWDVRRSDAPYLVKSPWLCDLLEDALRGSDIVIDHALIPIRDLYAAAQSRREVTKNTDPDRFAPGKVPGGLWHTDEPLAQEAVLLHQLYKLLYTLSKHEIPATLLHFPRLVHEPEYLYRSIGFVLNQIDYGTFLEAFHTVCRPELVHDFSPEESLVGEGSEPGQRNVK